MEEQLKLFLGIVLKNMNNQETKDWLYNGGGKR